MNKPLRASGVALVTVALALGMSVVAMRFHDGPIGIWSGGPFTTGAPTKTPARWDFVADRSTIELQTLDPATSRTVWLGVFQGKLFVLSGFMQTGYGKLWKQWPHSIVENDDRVILRVDGRLYEQRLRRIKGGRLAATVLDIFALKYNLSMGENDTPVKRGDVWMFEVVPR
ncbi:MAG: hypothetical protein ACO3Z6_09850 [Pseudomonadales bacterium]